MVKHLRFTALCGWDEMLIENLEDIFANVGKFGFDLLTVLLDQGDLALIALGLLLLLDGCYDPPRGATRTDNVLVSDGEEISLFDGELLVGGGNDLHILHHLCYWSAFLGIGNWGNR